MMQTSEQTSSQIAAQRRIDELEAAIRTVVTQVADDVCWMDSYVMLGKLVGIEVTVEMLALLPKDVMLRKCDQYITSLKTGCPYEKDYATERIKQLEIEVAALRQENAELKAQPPLTFEEKLARVRKNRG